jgi:hypothetical protein
MSRSAAQVEPCNELQQYSQHEQSSHTGAAAAAALEAGVEASAYC